MQVSGELHAPGALPQGKVSPKIVRLSGSQSQSALCREEKNRVLLPDIEPLLQPVDCHYNDLTHPALRVIFILTTTIIIIIIITINKEK